MAAPRWPARSERRWVGHEARVDRVDGREVLDVAVEDGGLDQSRQRRPSGGQDRIEIAQRQLGLRLDAVTGHAGGWIDTNRARAEYKARLAQQVSIGWVCCRWDVGVSAAAVRIVCPRGHGYGYWGRAWVTDRFGEHVKRPLCGVAAGHVEDVAGDAAFASRPW